MTKIIGNTTATPYSLGAGGSGDGTAPKEYIEFANGVKLISKEDGIYATHPDYPGDEAILYDMDYVGFKASEADYAEYANCDSYGNIISDTYAKKTEIPVVDQDFDPNSENAIANSSVSGRFDNLEETVDEALVYFGSAIDNHEDRILAIEPIVSDIGDTAVADQLIENNAAIYFGIVSESMIAYLGESPEAGFTSALYFSTPSEIPANYSQFPADVYFKGDSTDNGAFVPEANMRYTIVFDFDGYMINGYVSGVSMI